MATITSILPVRVVEPDVRLVDLRYDPELADHLDQFLEIVEGELTPEALQNPVIVKMAISCRKIGEIAAEIILRPASGEDRLNDLALAIIELDQELVNEIGGAPLKVAVLCNGKMWEEWMLEHCRRLFGGFSPIDGTELGTAMPFPFGNRIISWRERVNIASRLAPLKERITVLTPPKRVIPFDKDETEGCDDDEARAGYEDLFGKSDLRKAVIRLGEMCDRRRIEAMEERRLTEDRLALESAEALAALRRGDEAVKRNTKARDETHRQEVGLVQAMWDEERVENTRLRAWGRSMQAEIQGLRSEISGLNAKCASLEGRISSCEARANSSSGGGCTIM